MRPLSGICSPRRIRPVANSDDIAAIGAKQTLPPRATFFRSYGALRGYTVIGSTLEATPPNQSRSI